MDLQQQAQQAYQQGQQRQRELDATAAQRTGEYQQQLSAAQQAQRQLADYTRGLQGGGEQAQQYLQNQYQQLGINPQAIAQANQQIARTQAALSTAPLAAQQAGGGYGMTAGGQAQALTNMQGNLTGVLTAQAATADALSRQMNQALANAQMIEQSQLTSQEQKRQGYVDAANLAQGLAQNAAGVMNNVMQLAQAQGGVTAQQVAAYQNARASLISAQGTAAAAGAQAELYRQQAQYQRMINQALQNLQSKGQLSANQVQNLASILQNGSLTEQSTSNAVNFLQPTSTTQSTNLGNLLQGSSPQLQAR